MRGRFATTAALALVLLYLLVGTNLHGYVLNRTVADKRNSANSALGACPELSRFDTQTAGKLIDRRWHTTLNTNVHTTTLTTSARQNEVEQVILESFQAWASVTGTTLVPGSFGSLNRTTTTGACNSIDGLNTICFAQNDAFATGVVAFTNRITSDILGEQFPPSAPPSAFIGEILDADILFNPASNIATPSALAANANSFDLESVLLHELGHFFGFGHSGVWGAAMFPFVPPPGMFLGGRPTMAAPDAPLSDDDRTGLRVLYPDAADTLHVGAIRGRILPANPLSLAGLPANVTGIFGAHVVAIDDATGAVAAAALSGWSCSNPGPATFDGSYAIERLAISRSYRVYVEPLDGLVDPGHVDAAIQSLCHNTTTDPGWPAQFACTVPPVQTGFSTRARGQ